MNELTQTIIEQREKIETLNQAIGLACALIGERMTETAKDVLERPDRWNDEMKAFDRGECVYCSIGDCHDIVNEVLVCYCEDENCSCNQPSS